MGQMLQHTELDEFGLLINPADWTPKLARELAKLYKLDTLTGQHWAFIKSLRDYNAELHVPPPAYKLCHHLQLQRGCGHRLVHNCLDA